MSTFSVTYPESLLSVLNLSPDSFEAEARIALSMKLFEMGRLTSGQAANLAGISRAQFLLNCRQYGASSVKWDDDEIRKEFDTIG